MEAYRPALTVENTKSSLISLVWEYRYLKGLFCLSISFLLHVSRRNEPLSVQGGDQHEKGG